jgi:hypothetical protein
MARTGFVWRRKDVVERRQQLCREYRWERLRKTAHRYCYGIGKRVMRFLSTGRLDRRMADRALDKWLRVGKDLNQSRCLVVFKPEEVLDSLLAVGLGGDEYAGRSLPLWASKRLEGRSRKHRRRSATRSVRVYEAKRWARRTHQVSTRTPAMYDPSIRPGSLFPMDDLLTRWRRRQTGCESAISNEDQKSHQTHPGLVLRSDQLVRSFLLSEPELSIARCERHPVTIYGYEVDPFRSGVRPPDLLRSTRAPVTVLTSPLIVIPDSSSKAKGFLRGGIPVPETISVWYRDIMPRLLETVQVRRPPCDRGKHQVIGDHSGWERSACKTGFMNRAP